MLMMIIMMMVLLWVDEVVVMGIFVGDVRGVVVEVGLVVAVRV